MASSSVRSPPLKPKDIWAIRIYLQNAHAVRDLALFNLAIDSKLRGCDLVSLHVRDVRRNKHTSIEPDYDQAELVKALGFSDAISSMCAIEIAHLASDDKLALKVLERIRSF